MITEHPIGTVTNNDDPAKAGRIKVELAELDGQEWPEWLDPVWPAGHWICIPDVGDTVEVVLPEGQNKIEFSSEVRYRGKVLDPSNPVPEEFKINYPHRRGFKTLSGHMMIIDDRGEDLTLIHRDGHLISLTNDGIHFGTKGSSEPMVLGNLWKALMDTIMVSYTTHIHPTGVGPSGPPSDAAVWAAQQAQTAATISDFIFGQKAKP